MLLIEEADKQLLAWSRKVLGDLPVTLGLPPAQANDTGVAFYLMEARPEPLPRQSRTPRAQLVLRYLATTWAPDAQQAHALLGRLVVALHANSELELEHEPPGAELQRSLGIVPQPALVIRMRVSQELPVRRAPFAKRLVVEFQPAGVLFGQLTGPEELPLAGATVEIPELKLTCKTDTSGRFSFATVPAETPLPLLLVRAKGREARIDISRVRPGDSPLPIRIEMED